MAGAPDPKPEVPVGATEYILTVAKRLPFMWYAAAAIALPAGAGLALAFVGGSPPIAIFGSVAIFVSMIVLKLFSMLEKQILETIGLLPLKVVVWTATVAFVAAVVLSLAMLTGYVWKSVFPPTVDDPHEALILKTIGKTDSLSGDFELARSDHDRLPEVEARAKELAAEISQLPIINATWSLMCVQPQAFCWNIAVDARFCRLAAAAERQGKWKPKMTTTELRALVSADDRVALVDAVRKTLEHCDEFDRRVKHAQASVDEESMAIRKWLDTTRSTQIPEAIGYERCVAVAGAVLTGDKTPAEFDAILRRAQETHPEFWKRNRVETNSLLTTVVQLD